MNISWLPGKDGGKPILKYHIMYKKTKHDVWKSMVVDAPKKWMIFDDSFDQMLIKVAAQNQVGIGQYSDAVRVFFQEKGADLILN